MPAHPRSSLLLLGGVVRVVRLIIRMVRSSLRFEIVRVARNELTLWDLEALTEPRPQPSAHLPGPKPSTLNPAPGSGANSLGTGLLYSLGIGLL